MFKSLSSVRFFMLLKVSSAHQGCIYLIKNTVKRVKLWNIITISNNYFQFEYIVKCNLFLWCKAEYSASLLQSSVSYDPSEIILIWWFTAQDTFLIIIIVETVVLLHISVKIVIYTGAGHIIRISSKSWFISLIPFKKWNLYNVYIHSTQIDIFQVFIYFNFDDYNWQLMKTPNSVSQKNRILLKTNTKKGFLEILANWKVWTWKVWACTALNT